VTHGILRLNNERQKIKIKIKNEGFDHTKVLAKIARFLEKLFKMCFAIENSIHGGVCTHLDQYSIMPLVSHLGSFKM